MAEKRRLRGASGAIFVPHHTIDDVTIASQIASGEWSEIEESKPAAKKAPAKKSDKK